MKNPVLNRSVQTVVLLGILSGSTWAQSCKARIRSPKAKQTIKNHHAFPVETVIPSFIKDRKNKWHYWVSIAEVDDRNQPIRHWPKFYVKDKEYANTVHEPNGSVTSSSRPMRLVSRMHSANF